MNVPLKMMTMKLPGIKVRSRREATNKFSSQQFCAATG